MQASSPEAPCMVDFNNTAERKLSPLLSLTATTAPNRSWLVAASLQMGAATTAARAQAPVTRLGFDNVPAGNQSVCRWQRHYSLFVCFAFFFPYLKAYSLGRCALSRSSSFTLRSRLAHIQAEHGIKLFPKPPLDGSVLRHCDLSNFISIHGPHFKSI